MRQRFLEAPSVTWTVGKNLRVFNECKGKYEHFKEMIFGQIFDRFTIGIPIVMGLAMCP